eukprot:CAMPEP_0116879294 /NCGR_PEP_ID=MMETSP0463-20121206/11092_1 /TAXON_ID=181622 /ORGANISM="Strombidinopsis sp, Strain SopsisLIS2011" /LENGTH=75 /DNA_ID=CAMNT_0004528467 /DNA_START=535 /DNA_END=762 /DNA_ORIENTATION=-
MLKKDKEERKRDSNALLSQSSKVNSSISTPRLTPLRMVQRNHANAISQDDISRLEGKIKDLETNITAAKRKGEDK